MKNATNEEKLYNVLFPFWMILLFPQLWAIVLPGNFIIDSVVFAVSMLCLRLENKKHWYKKCILKIFGLGMLADIIGSIYMLALMLLFKIGNMGDELYLTLPALFISAVLIFVFDYFISFRQMDKKSRLILSLIFAILTAPYTFLIPSSWIYR